MNKVGGDAQPFTGYLQSLGLIHKVGEDAQPFTGYLQSLGCI